MVFKTNKAPEINGKVGRGSMCVRVSNIKEHIAKLISLGEILQQHYQNDFGLNHNALVTSHKIKGTLRLCTLIDIILRFLDVERIDKKRWFFRSVEAHYTGHNVPAKK
jgi:hypothetical protein